MKDPLRPRDPGRRHTAGPRVPVRPSVR